MLFVVCPHKHAAISAGCYPSILPRSRSQPAVTASPESNTGSRRVNESPRRRHRAKRGYALFEYRGASPARF